MGIRVIAQRRPRHIHFSPGRVGLIPERRSPGFVQIPNASILRFQKLTEGQRITFRVKFIFLTVDFIVKLPADDACPLCIVSAKALYNVPCESLIDNRIIVIMSSRTVPVKHTILARIQNFRILIRHPRRRCRRRRAENHLHVLLFAQIQESVKEVIRVFSLRWFEYIPGKFCHPDDFDARLVHPVQILSPQLLIPVLRVVIRSHDDAITIQQITHVGFPPVLTHKLLFFHCPCG